MKEPIYSSMQYPHARDKNGPLPLPGFADQYYDIVSQLNWRLFDFSKINQIVYAELDRINSELDSIPKEDMEYNDVNSMEDLARVRLREVVMNKDIENQRVHSFTDHMSVVGLWAICEQFMAKIYRRHVSKLMGVAESEVKAPYRWDDFNRLFLEQHINLQDCENYENANECRNVNNAIKHDPIIGKDLEKFDFFKEKVGEELEKVELEGQRYMNGVSDFLGSLIEKSQELVKA